MFGISSFPLTFLSNLVCWYSCPDSLIFNLGVLWVDLGSSRCPFQFLISGHNNLVYFLRRLYFPQVPYSHVAGELAIPNTRQFFSVPAANLISSISVPVSTTEPTNQITCSKGQLWIKRYQSQLFFYDFKLTNYQLHFWIQIFVPP